ncbi:MAG: adenylosuccinate lyase [Bacteroidetes bacterium]|nr:MAG: adenylosuccinate lyase [Bacteroidota bacterium]
MELNALSAISPIDGRYRKNTYSLAAYYSEYALIKYRVAVEIEYFIALCELGVPPLQDIDKKLYPQIWQIATGFDEKSANYIKEKEKTTNHDVKAVEYYVKAELEKIGLAQYIEFVHFGLTSQDINNTAIPLLIRDSVENEILPKLTEVLTVLKKMARDWMETPMLARTHGQPASPTRLGKEFMVFVERLESQMSYIRRIPYSAKFGGATGNFNAHHVAFPEVDWITFADRFINEKLRLHRSKYTTQIEHYDNTAALCDVFKRISTILIDFDRDIWQYVSMEYFKQKVNKNETGSSAMPHKVNPIDFENSEGNLGIAIALFEHFATKLPISRLQRDLTDSTVLRNIGMPFAHLYIALESTLKGLGKLQLNQAAIDQDLENNWAVVAEAIQTILRREGYPNPYETLKDLTRTGEKITQTTISEFIDKLETSYSVKKELRDITPFNYIGIVK